MISQPLYQNSTTPADLSEMRVMAFFGADRVSKITTARIRKYIESRLEEDASTPRSTENRLP